MKKLFLLGALVCAGQLYAMEMQPSYETLLPELKQEIVNAALATSKNIDEAISMIEKLSILHNVRYDNLKDFTKLVHLLADKFGISTMEIASKFNTATATEYWRLGNLLMQNIISSSNNKITKLISEGADVNLTEKHWLTDEDYEGYESLDTPLSWAKKIIYRPCNEQKHKRTIEILIEAGAK